MPGVPYRQHDLALNKIARLQKGLVFVSELSKKHAYPSVRQGAPLAVLNVNGYIDSCS